MGLLGLTDFILYKRADESIYFAMYSFSELNALHCFK